MNNFTMIPNYPSKIVVEGTLDEDVRNGRTHNFTMNPNYPSKIKS
jgi:hypothetical protein